MVEHRPGQEEGDVGVHVELGEQLGQRRHDLGVVVLVLYKSI